MTESTQDHGLLEEVADPEAARALAPTLELLENDVELLVFVGATCARCPHMIRSAATLALASERVALEVVEVSADPDLAAHYEVGGVPTTVVDDELIMVGVVAPDELALRLVERQGEEQARRVFGGLVAGGHVDAAADRLADGRGLEAFKALWKTADGEGRLVLMNVAEQSLLYNPFGIEPVVEFLREGLEDGSLADDEDRRLDTLELLEALEE